ncbi:MAG: esterase-like activity of phytase family protein [Rhodothalassiaceae bacterium]
MQIRLWAPVAILALLACTGILTAGWHEDPVQALQVEATSIPMDRSEPARRQHEALIYRGGLVLRAEHSAFGGFSAMVLDPDGRLHAISDRGSWFTASLEHGPDGTLTGVGEAQIYPMFGPLRDDADAPLDPEALTQRDGDVYLATEATPTVLRFAGGRLDAPEWLPLPQEMTQALPVNGGIEAMAALPDGTILMAAETLLTQAGHNQAWLWRDGTVQPLALDLPQQHRPTAMAALTNGDILVLLRRFAPLTGVSIKLGRFSATALAQDAVIAPEILATLRPPINIDNMEGLAVSETATGIRLYMISDDNFNSLQRTLLLSFDLADESRRVLAP